MKTIDAGGPRGYDGGKTTVGRKRHIVVDMLGMLLAVVVVHSGDRQDHSGAALVLFALREKLEQVWRVFADTAHERNGLPQHVAETLGIELHLVPRPRGGRGFAVLPRRWIVERTFAWIGRSRRHSQDHERNPPPARP